MLLTLVRKVNETGELLAIADLICVNHVHNEFINDLPPPVSIPFGVGVSYTFSIGFCPYRLFPLGCRERHAPASLGYIKSVDPSRKGLPC
jgi:hypothetical protein